MLIFLFIISLEYPGNAVIFLTRCEKNDIFGISSVNVILEVLHRLMMMVEAVRKKIIRAPDIAKKLKKDPEEIKQLSEYFVYTQKIMDMGIIIKSISFETILLSQSFRIGYGLMVNDSLIAACMQEEGIEILATNDMAFMKIVGLSIYRPGRY
jgi:predicted nucleic acid-binding protein